MTLTLAAGALTSNPGTKITADQVYLTGPAGINVNTNAVELMTALTSNADVTVVEDDDLVIYAINVGNADVTLTLMDNGQLFDGNGAGTLNITADDFVVTSPGGLNLDTAINTLTADSSWNNGDIIIRETNGLDLYDINAGSGDVTMTLAAGALTSNPGTTITADEAILTAPAGIMVYTNITELTATTLILTLM